MWLSFPGLENGDCIISMSITSTDPTESCNGAKPYLLLQTASATTLHYENHHEMQSKTDANGRSYNMACRIRRR